MRELQTKIPRGRVIRDRYVIEDLLGKGGFGAVYRVRDRRVKGNVFALKEVNNPNRHQRESFFFEGELLRRLDHSSLPRVYRVFEENKNDRICMLMDYIEGPNLERLRSQQPGKRFPLAQVVQMMEPIIKAASYLHRQDPPIIHRDIKPSNIIIPSSGEDAMLVDFGIAKEYEEDSTTTAIRHCSPGYGAPEQYVSGTSKQTDVYGLAATIYTLLTGMVPIDSLYRITRLSVKRADPLQLASDLSPAIPVALAEVLQRGLAVNSQERYDTVEEFWQALHVFVSDPSTEPVVSVRGCVSEISNYEAAPILTSASVILPGSDAIATSLPDTPKPVNVCTTTPVTWSRHETRPRRLLYSSIVLLFFALIIIGSLSAANMFARAQNTTHMLPPSSVYITATVRTSTQMLHPTPRVSHTPPMMVQKPTSVPTVAPTSTPTMVPTVPSSLYPSLASSYSGPLYDTQASVHSSVSLSSINQAQSQISGYIAFGSGLIGDGNFNGTVTTARHISFLVSTSGSILPLFFQGQIQTNGSIAGTYCSYNNGHCDYQGGGYGIWNVSS